MARVFGLFSGIGGVEHGFRESGHEIVGHCEIDDGARAVLIRRFPEARKKFASDVRALTHLPRGTEVLTGGFPCQDLSQVGTTRGLKGKNSGLVREVFRLIAQSAPPTVILENVPFMLRLGRGAALRVIVRELEELGYSWAYRVVNTRSFGLPQRRERVFLVAMKRDDPRSILFTDDAGAPPTPANMKPAGASAFGFYWTEGNRGIGWAIEQVPTIKGGSSIGVPSPPAIWFPQGRDGFRIVTPALEDAERLQGFSSGWTEPAETVDGVSRRHRWKLVGNAVSVPVASWIGERLLRPQERLDVEEWPLGKNDPWPDAAYSVAGERFGVELSRWPFRLGSRRTLDGFLKYKTSPLSVRATMGFADRLEQSGLVHPHSFARALRAHQKQILREGVA